MAKKNSNTLLSSTIEDLLISGASTNTTNSCATIINSASTNTTNSCATINGGLGLASNIYIPTTTSTQSNITWTTSPSIGYTSIDINTYSQNLIKFTKFMKESEIIEIIDRIQANEDNEFARTIVDIVVSNRHMSENFLLKYISYLSLDTIKKQHTADIATGEYSDVALYFKLK